MVVMHNRILHPGWCHKVLLFCDTQTHHHRDDATQSLGSPFCGPCKEGCETFPSLLLRGDPQLSAELFEATLLVLCPQKDRTCGPS